MGKLAVIKTKQTERGAEEFIQAIQNEQLRKDSEVLARLMQKYSKEKPKLWGKSMIGFGLKRYQSPASGREVDWFKIGFSPRKANLSLHLVFSIKDHSDKLKKLGRHKAGAGCIYINKLEDVDQEVLEELIQLALTGK